MIISHQHKFIFFKTAKTAGTSMEIALSKFCGKNDIITPIVEEDEIIRQKLGYRKPQNYEMSAEKIDLRIFRVKQDLKFYNHISAKEIKPWLREEIWQEYFKFCFERHPYERVVSLYFHYINYLPPEEKCLSLSDFINSSLINGLRQWGFDIYTINSEIIVDQVFFSENLAEEILKISQKLNLPEPIKLPQAKAQYRKSKNLASDLLNQSQKDKINEIFAEEIQQFRY